MKHLCPHCGESFGEESNWQKKIREKRSEETAEFLAQCEQLLSMGVDVAEEIGVTHEALLRRLRYNGVDTRPYRRKIGPKSDFLVKYREYREEMQLTRKETAERMGMTLSKMGSFEVRHGIRKPNKRGEQVDQVPQVWRGYNLENPG